MQPLEDSTPKWLMRTQERSWEPEILISGIVLLALTQVTRLLDGLHFWLEERTSMFYFYTSDVDDMFFSALKVSTYWLMTGLIFHLILRSIWVSFVGLSYTFPEGIKLEKLRLQPWFHDRLLRLPDFKSAVVRLENICSAMYAIAFMLVMATISLVMFLLFVTLLAVVLVTITPRLIESDGNIDRIMIVLVLLTAMPYFIDFMTLGWLKRLSGFWKVYRYVYRFMGAITFAGVYRGIYYGLITNISRWKVFFLIFVYVAITAFGVIAETKGSFGRSSLMGSYLGLSTMDGYYRDTQPDRYSTWAHIQSQTIDNGVLELFLVYKAQFDGIILKNCDNLQAVVDSPDVDPYEKSQKKLECLKALHTLKIDNETVDMGHPYMRELSQTGQMGLSTWIDVSHLDHGHHVLEVVIHYSPGHAFTHAHIPFFLNTDTSKKQPPVPSTPQSASDVPDGNSAVGDEPQ